MFRAQPARTPGVRPHGTSPGMAKRATRGAGVDCGGSWSTGRRSGGPPRSPVPKCPASSGHVGDSRTERAGWRSAGPHPHRPGRGPCHARGDLGDRKHRHAQDPAEPQRTRHRPRLACRGRHPRQRVGGAHHSCQHMSQLPGLLEERLRGLLIQGPGVQPAGRVAVAHAPRLTFRPLCPRRSYFMAVNSVP